MCCGHSSQGSAVGDSLFVDFTLGGSAVAVKRSAAAAGLAGPASAAKRVLHSDGVAGSGGGHGGCGGGGGGGAAASSAIDVDSEDELLYATAEVRGDSAAVDELSGGSSSGGGVGAGGVRLVLLDVIPAVSAITDMCMGVAPKTDFEEEEVRSAGVLPTGTCAVLVSHAAAALCCCCCLADGICAVHPGIGCWKRHGQARRRG